MRAFPQPCTIEKFVGIMIDVMPLAGGKNASLGERVGELASKGIRGHGKKATDLVFATT